MTPDSIILLDANARLTHLIDVMNDALAHAKSQRVYADAREAWDTHAMAWERLMDELMSQVDQPICPELSHQVPTLYADVDIHHPIP